jgi:hypothetical protein
MVYRWQFEKNLSGIVCGTPIMGTPITLEHLLKGLNYLLEMLQKGIDYPLESKAKSKRTTSC